MRALSTMCSAIFLRITLIGSTRTLSPGLNVMLGAERARARCRAGLPVLWHARPEAGRTLRVDYAQNVILGHPAVDARP